MLLRPIIATALFTLSMSTYAQTINTKSGLWIIASKSVVNGQKLPGILDIKGIGEADKLRIRTALKTMGVPSDWNPAFYCQKSDVVDLNEILRKMKTECPNPSVQVNGSNITYSGKCNTEKGNANINGKTVLVSKTETKSDIDATFNIQGRVVKMHQEEVSKWLGSNCNVPPAGIDPMWVQAVMIQ